ncbi:type II CAAX prenyl endopeptidase Rce1 family protein [Brevibacterium aurantiacum]|uniref:CPBP family intramembrane metalloprotease n=1 Tax=Brevibacterium aurantiacum TaxID=273384 RepID=A0A556C9N5_BREAU|nr:CPBP family glutamic-type intramembrane protease [Brevibacterium aurantiacum]TSI14090.1 CPBP family intramembrane metalloprotease [Brevibacterium aurantiacum]
MTPKETVKSTPVWVGVATVIAAMCLLAAGFSAPGSVQFFAASTATATVYFLAFFIVPMKPPVIESGHYRNLGIGILAGLALLGVFIAGALLIYQIPALAHPVQGLLENARGGALLPSLLVTAVNGVAEELHFRRTIPGTITGSPWKKIVISLAAYMAVSSMLGVPLLVFAALVVGALAHWLVHRGYGLLAPIVMHLAWSLGMSLLLPVILR